MLSRTARLNALIFGGLVLLAALAAPAALAQSLETVEVDGEVYYGVRALTDYDVTGTYLYEGQGEPSVVLNADGTGAFAHHGRAGLPMRWWLQSDEAGAPMTEQGDTGQGHVLLVLFEEVPRGSESHLSRMSLTIGYTKMFILGEREKPY